VKAAPHLAVCFVGAALVVALVLSPVNTYLLNDFEPAWGRGGSTQVYWWVALLWAPFALATVGLGAAAARPRVRVAPPISVGAGAAFAAISMTGSAFLDRASAVVPDVVAAIWYLGVPAGIGYTLARWGITSGADL
jgi:hypothetical protein